MKNQTSFQLLELININSMTTVKGGTATMSSASLAVAKPGEWWGGGAL